MDTTKEEEEEEEEVIIERDKVCTNLPVLLLYIVEIVISLFMGKACHDLNDYQSLCYTDQT